MALIILLYDGDMQKIFELCPTLKALSFDAQMDAVVRMCIAHVMNGGEYNTLYETATSYLTGVELSSRASLPSLKPE